jgi:ABC-type glycerol-3-phosphate transport system permease component
MKKTIIILAAIAIGIVLFLIGAYFVALNISKKEKPADSPNRVFTFLKNPTSPRYEDTASSTGNFVTITTTGTSTGTSTIQTLVRNSLQWASGQE